MIHCHDVRFAAMPDTKSHNLADLPCQTYPHFALPHEKDPMTFGLFMRLKWGRERFRHSFILLLGGIRMFVSDFEILGMRSLRVFQNTSFADAFDPRGWTPLHLAALEGRAGVVALLLRSGASVEVRDRRGRRPQSCGSHGELCWGGEPMTSCLFLVPSHFEEAK